MKAQLDQTARCQRSLLALHLKTVSWGSTSRLKYSLWCKTQMPLNKTLRRFSFNSVERGTKGLFQNWSLKIGHQPLLNHQCKMTALQARTKRKWIFCILFHVIFVAFKSNINYSCDMRNGFSVLSGDTACESAVRTYSEGPTRSLLLLLLWSCQTVFSI